MTRDMHASDAGIDPRSVIDAERAVAVVVEEVLRRFEAGLLGYPTIEA